MQRQSTVPEASARRPQHDRAPVKSPARAATHTPHPLPILQKLVGNRALGRLVQAKLRVSRPGDAHEQEADRVAELVTAAQAPAATPDISPAPRPAVQRACASCEEEEEKEIHRKAVSPAAPPQSAHAEGPAGADAALGRLGGGRPLPQSLRADFEPRFGYDFRDVRVHTGAEAAEAARSFGALAFTVGRDVVFGEGQFSPDTEGGRRLLAHELTHTIQQSQPSGFTAFEPAVAIRPESVMLSRSAEDENSLRPVGARQIAALLHQATDEKIGTDEDAIFNALSGRTPAELDLIKEAFQTLSKDKRSLETVLEDELSGDDLSLALSLLHGGTSATEAARRLWDAMRGPGTNEEVVYATAAGRTATQWAEIQRAYRTLTGTDLLVELRDELTDAEWNRLQSLLPAPSAPGETQTKGETDAAMDARAASIAAEIRAAIDPPGTDEPALYAALTGRTEAEIQAVAKLFGGMEEFDKRLRDELTDAEYDIVRPLLRPGDPDARIRPLVVRLHDELHSLFPSQMTVESILGGRSGGDQRLIRVVYESLYGVPMEREVRRAFGPNVIEEHMLSRFESEGFRRKWEEALEQGLQLMREKYDAGEKNPDQRGCWFPSAGELKRRQGVAPYDEQNWQVPKEPERTPTLDLSDPDSLNKGTSLDEKVGQFTAEFTPTGTPHDAVDSLFKNLHRWQCDCARYVEIAWLYAWHRTLPKEEFNERFRNLRLRKQGTTGLYWEPYQNTDDALHSDECAKTTSFDEKWNNAPVGTKVIWKNRSFEARAPWENENAVKIEKHADWREDRYDAHPMGRKLLESEVRMLLAMESSDFPDQVFELKLSALKQLKAQGLDNLFLAALVELKNEYQKIEGPGPFWKKLGSKSEALDARLRQSSAAKSKDKQFHDKDMELVIKYLGRPGTAEEKEAYVCRNIRRLQILLPR